MISHWSERKSVGMNNSTTIIIIDFDKGSAADGTMKFRPCIDIHNGIVKQIVGSTLSEGTDNAPVENFAASVPAAEFARRYQVDGLTGGHVIMLGPNCEQAATEALQAYPEGLQIGGGITAANARMYVERGAAQVIVTSFVFKDGTIDFERLQQLKDEVGRERLVIDLSCRKRAASDGEKDPKYYVVTNKWTKYTDFSVTIENLQLLSQYCVEFLVHGVDVEGKRAGIEEELVQILGEFASRTNVPVTYAGGIRSLEDLELVKIIGKNMVDCTVGSALDIFGGDLRYDDVLRWHREQL